MDIRSTVQKMLPVPHQPGTMPRPLGPEPTPLGHPGQPAIPRPDMPPQNPPAARPGTPVMGSRPPTPQAAPPVSAIAPPSSAPPGAPVSSFGPGNDLLSTQINPNMGGPNRTELAQKSIADWEAQDAPRMAAEQRAVGQNAAKFGRIGAGMTTNDLTGVAATHARDRMSFQNALASNLASDTIGDQRSNNDELRTERDYQTGRSDKAQQDAINQRTLEEDILNSQFGRAQARTNAGYRDSPVDTMTGFSGALGQQAGQAIGAGTDLLRGGQGRAMVDPTSFGGMIPGAPSTSPINTGKPIVRNY